MSRYMTADEIARAHSTGERFRYANDWPWPWQRGQILTDEEVEDAIVAAQLRELLERALAPLEEAFRAAVGCPHTLPGAGGEPKCVRALGEQPCARCP